MQEKIAVALILSAIVLFLGLISIDLPTPKNSIISRKAIVLLIISYFLNIAKILLA